MAGREELTETAGKKASAPEKAAPPLRVLHVLATSLPYLNGYTIRSKYIVETQRQEGLEPVVATSPFYPGVDAIAKDAVISDIRYHRVPHPVDSPGPRSFSDWACIFLHRMIGARSGLKLKQRVRLPSQLLKRAIRGTWHVANCLLDWRVAMAQQPGARWVKYLKMAPLLVLYPLLKGIQLMGKAIRATHSIEMLPKPMEVVLTIVLAPFRALFWVLDGIADAIKRAAANTEESLLLRRFEEELVRIAGAARPDIIHAHSPYRCGIPALRAAHRLGLPMVYEVRGLWEETSVASGRFSATGARYRSWRRKEAEVMSQADAVVVICEQLRQEVVARGAAPDRVFVVPNAADTSVFRRGEAATQPGAVPALAADVRARLRPHTLGYVGSLRKLEGVDELVKAAAMVIRRGYDVSLLIVGDGPDLAGLKTLAEEEGIADRAVFTGRVPHDQVTYFYDFIDVFVISRPALRVTKLVTPLKPLEAMAMGKALVVSDLPSLREIIKENETGLLYSPGKPDDLAEKCITLLQDPALRQCVGQAAQKWIQQERTWSAVLKGLGPAYEAATRHSGGAERP